MSESKSSGPHRREVLAALGAAAAAGAVGCDRPRAREELLARHAAPEHLLPGEPIHYATACAVAGRTIGLLVKCIDGRPTKLDGNSDHPFSFGGTWPTHQALLHDLYDSHRLRTPMRDGQASDWKTFDSTFDALVGESKATGGRGLCFLSRRVPSTTLLEMRARVEARFPEARWYTYEPISEDHQAAAMEAAFGEPVVPQPRFSNAQLVVSLDADFLAVEGDAVYATRLWAHPRRLERTSHQMPRLYVVDGGSSLTGANADHRLAVRARDVEAVTWALAAALRKRGAAFDAATAAIIDRIAAALPPPANATFVEAVADDLFEHKRACLVLAGRRQPPSVHALVCAMNHALENAGRTLQYMPDPRRIAGETGDYGSIAALARRLEAGEVDTVINLGGNPIYDAPGSLRFAAAWAKARNRISLSDRLDETARASTWALPRAHFLEVWGDLFAIDGTTSIQQPVVAPLHGARADIELVARALDVEETDSFSLVHSFWMRRDQYLRLREQQRASGLLDEKTPAIAARPVDASGAPEGMVLREIRWSPFEYTWQMAQHAGFISHRLVSGFTVNRQPIGIAGFLTGAEVPETVEGIEVGFPPDHYVFDGTYAQRPHLLEAPDPITGLSWDNAAVMSEATAKSLGVASQEHVSIEVDGRAVIAPAWIVAGHPDDQISLSMGWGRIFEGDLPHHVDGRVGYDAHPLRSPQHPDWVPRAEVKKAPGRAVLALVAARDVSMPPSLSGGSPLVQELDFDTNRRKSSAEPRRRRRRARRERSVTPEGFQWGMVVNLNACIGCNACGVACAIENNIPAVGRDEVRIGGDMRWIRVERAGAVDVAGARGSFVPVMCQHCQKAPCEPACKAGAISTSPEGLNEQNYQRCEGLETCMPACPFGVRRFNRIDHTHPVPELTRLARNPHVSVRINGIAEKCNYCVQRINDTKRRARLAPNDERAWSILDDMTTACAQACPTQAIIFGDTADADSDVSLLKRHDRNYEFSYETGVEARTTYLARVQNPNQKLSGQKG